MTPRREPERGSRTRARSSEGALLRRNGLAVVLWAVAWGAAAGAAPALAAPPTPPAERDATPRVQESTGLPEPAERPAAYLVTVGPGDAVWERFGHNLIWIHDPATGADVGYNYGLFSFEQEHFLLRFIQGRMRYWMAGLPLRRQLEAYRSQDRSIRVQELALTPLQVHELHRFLEWNERPENRFYGYDYYRDNCSTRVRDALDRILDGRLESWARARATEASYRDHTLRQTHGLFWVSVGMHFGLGPDVDEPLTAWEAMFIPMELERHLRDFTVEDEEGRPVPLVRSEWTYHASDRAATPATTPRWLGLFGVLGATLAAAFATLGWTVRTVRTPRPTARRSLLGLATAWLAVVGLLGVLIGLLWAFTDHWGTRGNLNLSHAGLLHLVLAALIWSAFGARGRLTGVARWTAAGVAALSLVGLGVQALPGVAQVNGEFLLFLVPANLALAWSVWRGTSTRPPEAAPTGERHTPPT